MSSFWDKDLTEKDAKIVECIVHFIFLSFIVLIISFLYFTFSPKSKEKVRDINIEEVELNQGVTKIDPDNIKKWVIENPNKKILEIEFAYPKLYLLWEKTDPSLKE